MASIDAKDRGEPLRSTGGEWSHRRSAAFVLAGGAAFWLILLFILFHSRFF